MDRERYGDTAIGLVFAAGGVGIVTHGSGLRTMPGTIVGSGLFPMITGALMLVFGLALSLASLAGRNRARGVPPEGEGASRGLVYPVAVLAAIVMVTLLLPTLGFVIGGTLFAAAVARLGGAGWLGSLLCAAALAIGLYVVFVHGLGVPLPRGPLE